MSNSSQQLQQAFTLSWFSGAHHSRSGVLSQACERTPPPICVDRDYSLNQFMANWPYYQIMAALPLGHTHLSWPYPKPFSSLANSAPHQTAGQSNLFCTWRAFVPSRGLWSLQQSPGPLAHPVLLGGFGPFRPPEECGTF
ncbi:hypothetical protein O181_023193 [Austropuccinia psidii MF-1]|uniref:Uncharacterized protein n=1 Tax=Austropuccinia psidii MF-1 TaxID=1389203 RepID=A0A9Q3CIB8_9BASI|nr:hypothetical protein [Austropuccinia psidii MF-1]